MIDRVCKLIGSETSYPYSNELKLRLAAVLTAAITGGDDVGEAVDFGDIVDIRAPTTGATIFHILFSEMISHRKIGIGRAITDLVNIFPFAASPFAIRDRNVNTCLHVLFFDHKCNVVRDLVNVVAAIAPHVSPADMMVKDANGNTVWHVMFGRVRDAEVFKPLAHLFSAEALRVRNHRGQTPLFILFSNFKYGDNEVVVDLIMKSLTGGGAGGTGGILEGDMRARENNLVDRTVFKDGGSYCGDCCNDTVWHKLFYGACHYPSALAVLKKLMHLLTPADMRAVNAKGETCWHKLFWVSSKTARDTIKLIAGLPPMMVRRAWYAAQTPVEWLTRDDLVQRTYENESCVDLLMYQMNAVKFEVFQFIEARLFGSVELSLGRKRTRSEVASSKVEESVQRDTKRDVTHDMIRDVFRHRCTTATGNTGAHFLRESKNEYADRVFNRIIPFLDTTIKNNDGETVLDL